MEIVFPNYIDLDESLKVKFKDLGVQTYDYTPNDEPTIIERIRNAEIITANLIDMPHSIIDAAPKLKFIIALAVGYEWIDTEYAASKGIKVLNCPTQNIGAVAEHALALMFAVSRRVVEASVNLQQGYWNPPALIGTELSCKKLGLIGYGRVGKLIEQKVSGMEMDVGYVNSGSSDRDLDKLLKESDVVCLCLPLNDTTRNIINAKRLQMLKSNAIFINVARGDLVDQSALFELLRAKPSLGAGLDVFQDEPLAGNTPEAVLEIAKLPNVVATPHIAYNTHDRTKRLGQELLDNVISCIQGNPINVVN